MILEWNNRNGDLHVAGQFCGSVAAGVAAGRRGCVKFRETLPAESGRIHAYHKECFGSLEHRRQRHNHYPRFGSVHRLPVRFRGNRVRPGPSQAPPGCAGRTATVAAERWLLNTARRWSLVGRFTVERSTPNRRTVRRQRPSLRRRLGGLVELDRVLNPALRVKRDREPVRGNSGLWRFPGYCSIPGKSVTALVQVAQNG